MTSKLTITRDELNEVVATYGKSHIAHRMATELLAAMDSELVGKPFMYGIADPDGNAYIDELCVSEDLGLVEDTVNELNYDREEGDELNYSVVALYRHAQPATQLKPVGYLFVSDQGAIAYSPTDWGMPGFKLAGQIFGDIDVKAQPAPLVSEQPAPVVPLPDVVSVLLNHLEDVLPDDAFNLIDVKAWNAVSMLTCHDACRAAMLNGGKS